MPDICLYFQVHQPNRLAAPGGAADAPLVAEDDALNAALSGFI